MRSTEIRSSSGWRRVLHLSEKSCGFKAARISLLLAHDHCTEAGDQLTHSEMKIIG